MNNYPVATIFGAGGFIGRYLVRKMTEKNFQCIIPTRNAYLKGYLKTQAPPGAIEFTDFNPKDFSNIQKAIENSDIVINLIGILFENKKQKFSNMHSDFPEFIAKLCAKSEVDAASRIGVDGHHARERRDPAVREGRATSSIAR